MKHFKSLQRMIVIGDKEWVQIRRDTRSLILSIFVPIILVLLFGYALNVDVKNVKMAVFNQDKGFLSRQYVEKFSHTEYLSIVTYSESYNEIDALMNSGEIVMALIIPVDFEKRYKSGKIADIQLLIDGSDSTAATIASAYIKIITYEFIKEILEKELKGIGISSVKMPIAVKNRIWYNSELKSKNFIIPGLIVLILAIISALITSLTISREWERGTMETLITTPVKGYEVVLGKLIPYIFIGIFDVVSAMSIGYFIFDVPMKGSFVELCIVATLFLIGTSSLGILISSATRIQVLSVQVAIIVTYLPSFMLSDFIFPIQNMPMIIKAITYIVPAKYLIFIMKGIVLKGIGYSIVWSQILFLLIFTIIVVMLSIKKFSILLPEK